MGTRAVITFVTFTAGAVLACVSVGEAWQEPDDVRISGTVTANCATLHANPLPRVFTATGTELRGEPWLSATTGAGTCIALFSIDAVQRADRYQVRIGPATGLVDWRDTVGNVHLVSE